VEPWPIDKLVPYARNARTHSGAQVAQIAASMREWGWTNPVLVDPEGMVIAGHGRVLAARQLGVAEVPVMVARGWSETQKRAYVLADNQLALNAEWDLGTLGDEWADLEAAGFEMDLIGFSDIDALLAGAAEPDEEEVYSRRIDAPIYEPTGSKPDVFDLMDRDKTKGLLAEIGSANLPDDVRLFLACAAERHTVFDFAAIAEFYAHSEPDVQALMERSALVIIDFKRAIEEGFVILTEKMGAMADGMRKRK
jgi:hypothetical protein